MPRYGLDTGFFVRLFAGTDRTRAVWTDIVEASAEGVVSSVTAYELQRNALPGLLVREDVEEFLEELPILCVVHDTLSMDSIQRAAHLGWGNGVSMTNALILQAFLDEDVSHIVTTDRDLAAYEGDLEIEVL